MVYEYAINIWFDSWLTSARNKDNKSNQESTQTLLCGLFLSIAGWGYLCQNIFQKLLRWVFKTRFITIYSNDHNLITIKIHWCLAIAILFWSINIKFIWLLTRTADWPWSCTCYFSYLRKPASVSPGSLADTTLRSLFCIIRFRKLNSCRVPQVYLTRDKCSIRVIIKSELWNIPV